MKLRAIWYIVVLLVVFSMICSLVAVTGGPIVAP